MAAPLFDFTDPDTAHDVDDDVQAIRDNLAVVYCAGVAAAMGVPILLGASQTATATPAAKPTTIEFTGLPGSRKVRFTITYDSGGAGENPVTIVTALDSGSGYETLSTQTLTYDGSDNWTGATT